MSDITCGCVSLYFEKETGKFLDASIDVIQNGVRFIPNAINTFTLILALRHTFDDGREYTSSGDVVRAMREKGTTWVSIMPLVDNPETFCLVSGPIVVNVSTTRMKEVYRDLLGAFEQAGGLSQYLPA